MFWPLAATGQTLLVISQINSKRITSFKHLLLAAIMQGHAQCLPCLHDCCPVGFIERRDLVHLVRHSGRQRCPAVIISDLVGECHRALNVSGFLEVQRDHSGTGRGWSAQRSQSPTSSRASRAGVAPALVPGHRWGRAARRPNPGSSLLCPGSLSGPCFWKLWHVYSCCRPG